MSVTVVVQESAANEIRDASAWYECKRITWASGSRTRLFQSLGRIENNPTLFGRVYKDVRRAPVHRFPYGVFYRLSRDTVTVISVMHGRRNLKRLKNRLDD
jgi:toxin ParE1/3/4